MTDDGSTCDGLCEPCEPPIQRVRIVDGPPLAMNRWNGYEFSYCRRAIREDEEKGFTVRRLRRPTTEEEADG